MNRKHKESKFMMSYMLFFYMKTFNYQMYCTAHLHKNVIQILPSASNILKELNLELQLYSMT